MRQQQSSASAGRACHPLLPGYKLWELWSKLLKGGFIQGTTIGVIKRDTRSLDCSFYRFLPGLSTGFRGSTVENHMQTVMDTRSMKGQLKLAHPTFASGQIVDETIMQNETLLVCRGRSA